MTQAPELWRAWLEQAGASREDSVPPPLDRFLSSRRPDTATFRALMRACAHAATVAAALCPGPWAGSRAALLAQLRGLPPRDVLDAADHCADGQGGGARGIGRAVRALRAALEGNASWEARCLLSGVPAAWAPVVAARAERSGEAWARAWLMAQRTRPPLWVRPRSEQVLASLRAEGWQAGLEPDGAAWVRGDKGIETSSAFRQGQLEVQDRASQRVGALASPRPGQVVWDMCAGRGGKTVLMGHALSGRGSIHATDTDERKLVALKQRIKRAGLSDHVRIHAWDGVALPPFGPEARRGFDIVLIDAPCSSTGTWRRNPDARLRLDPQDLGAFAATQRALLQVGARALRPGGRLVYSTCSIAVQEDEALVTEIDPDARCSLFGPPDLDSDTLFGAALSIGRE